MSLCQRCEEEVEQEVPNLTAVLANRVQAGGCMACRPSLEGIRPKEVWVTRMNNIEMRLCRSHMRQLNQMTGGRR